MPNTESRSRLSVALLPSHLRRRQQGSTVVEFVLVAVLLLFLLLAILQVAVYLYVRNVVVASASEGARYAASTDISPAQGGARATALIRSGVGSSVARHLDCSGSTQEADGFVEVVVRCRGALSVFFAPLGEVLPVDVEGHAFKEGT